MLNSTTYLRSREKENLTEKVFDLEKKAAELEVTIKTIDQAMVDLQSENKKLEELVKLFDEAGTSKDVITNAEPGEGLKINLDSKTDKQGETSNSSAARV